MHTLESSFFRKLLANITAMLFVLACSCGNNAAADTPAPFASECAVIDRIAASPRPMLDTMVRTLEAIATDRVSTLSADALNRLEIRPDMLKSRFFGDPTVRAYAYYKLGETGLPEVEAFLRNQDPKEFDADKTHQTVRAARIAYLTVKLRMEPTPAAQVPMLEAALFEKHDARIDGAVKQWAADTLCDRGSSKSLPLIEKSYHSRYSESEYVQMQVRRCKIEMDVLSTSPSRVKALIKALNMPDPIGDLRFRAWAIEGLLKEGGTEANAALRKYADEISKAPADSPNYPQLYLFQRRILDRLPKSQ